MNTPLLSRLASACRLVIGQWADRRFSQPPLDQLGDLQFAELALGQLAGFVLDWRRVEDGLPPREDWVLVATHAQRPMIKIGRNDGFWRCPAWTSITGVYAWAPIPPPPRPEQLIGFAPRSP